MREMKDSGIEWIGDIPQAWSVVPVKYLLTKERDSLKVGPFGSQLAGNDFVDEGYWVYNQRAVIDKNFVDNTVFVTEEKYRVLSAFQIRTDDILITTRGTIGRICRIPAEHMEGIIHPCIIKFRVDEEKIIYEFLEHIFNDSDFVNRQIFYKSNATTIDVIYGDTLKNIILPVPPLTEQKMIIDFLRPICLEVENLKKDIQQQIDTLEQYKRSVITEAVTKGLNPEAEMKDSGIEWVGEIPSHWNIHPVYTYFGERKNKNKLGLESNLLSLSYGKVVRKDINTNEGLLPESFNTYNIVEPGDIIIRPTDLQNDKRSLRTGLVTEHGIITSAYIDLCPIKQVDSRYFHYLLHAYDVMKVFYNMGNGVRQGLNYSEFSRLMVFEPAYEEQREIADYLDGKVTEADAVIADKKAQLETLEEYKKSLIFEYVTGKKEVPA